MAGKTLTLPAEEDTRALGAALARAEPWGCTVYLRGDLGAGKTTLAREFLRALGITGPVRSPTYTLLESYEAAGRLLYHLDLYRLADPEELEYLGVRDLLGDDAVILVEWPERGEGFLPKPDLDIHLAYEGNGRRATLRGRSERGRAVVQRLAGCLSG